MQQGKLTHAWVQASASLPLGWTLRGIVLGPRETDPAIHAEDWCAWAKGPAGERADELGAFPEQAPYNLAERLQLIRGDSNG